MNRAFSQIGAIAARGSVSVLAAGVGTLLVGVVLQIAQGRGLIGALPTLGQGTVFGLMSKIGGAVMLLGLVCGALRDNTSGTNDTTVPTDELLLAGKSTRFFLARPGSGSGSKSGSKSGPIAEPAAVALVVRTNGVATQAVASGSH